MYLVLSLVFLLFAGCSSEKKPPKTMTFSGNAMTMDYQVTIGEHMEVDQIEKVMQAIEDVFGFVDQTYNKFNPLSELSELNRLPPQEKMVLSAELADLLVFCQKIHELTEGRFDPTIETIQKKWRPALAKGSLPQDLEIQPLLSIQDVVIENQVAYKTKELQLDLSGIAKGKAVDLITEKLLFLGYQHFLVSWSGELRAHGSHPANRPWQIALTNKKTKEKQPLSVPLENQAIATSGDSEQYWKVDETFYTHIFHTRTQKPLVLKKNGWSRVSVITESCALSDALATAIMTVENQNALDYFLNRLKKRYPEAQFWVIKRQQLPQTTGKL